MNEVKALLVVWQDEKSRLYYHVGTLSNFEGYYEFEYTQKLTGQRKLGDALKVGYLIHPAFPETNKVYRSPKLFPAFDRRIPSNDRQDFEGILADLGLHKEASKMEILRATRGRIAADSYSFEEPLRYGIDGKLRSSFFVHGMRHQKLSNEWFIALKEGEKVKFVQEPSNPHDDYAIEIYSLGGEKLGYVPNFYSQAISWLLDKGMEYTAKITYINEKSHAHWWMKLSYESEMPVEKTIETEKLTRIMQSQIL